MLAPGPKVSHPEKYLVPKSPPPAPEKSDSSFIATFQKIRGNQERTSPD